MSPLEEIELQGHGKEERRSGYVALSTEFILELEKHIKEENNLFRSIKLAGGVFSTLVIVLTWIFIEKNGDIKEMQQTLNQHAVAITKTLTILEVQIATSHRQVTAHEKLEERVNTYIISGPRTDNRTIQK